MKHLAIKNKYEDEKGNFTDKIWDDFLYIPLFITFCQMIVAYLYSFGWTNLRALLWMSPLIFIISFIFIKWLTGLRIILKEGEL